MGREAPIAVVGLGGLFPGAPTLGAFWQNVVSRVDTTREVPPGRWILDPRDVYDPRPKPDHVYSTRGCYLDDFALDPAGLDVDRDLLAALDPLYHLVLHAGRQAFSDARTERLNRDRTGVILAAIALPTDSSSKLTREVLGRAFERRLFAAAGVDCPTTDEPHPSHPSLAAFLNARATGAPAGLLATALGLGGGSYTLDAACASSLYAIKLACDELRAGRANAMLAGGVSRPECLYTQMGFGHLQALSPSGCCRPFDAGADGLVVGEGAGVVILKRLDDALGDGDQIYGMIRAIGVSNDIAGSLLAADSEGQLRAMRSAYETAGWSPYEVDYIECHGTGTPLGDAVELHSMRSLWGESGWRRGQCGIGSVKSMIGHLLTAAGAAGLIKTLLAMRAGQLPPSLNFERAKPELHLDDGPFRVQTRAEPWERRMSATPRRAAVSAFGFGGINAHLLVEEHVGKPAKQSAVRVRRGGRSPAQPIAIVGMEARVGALQSLRAFQEVVLEGTSAMRPRPTERWHGCESSAAGDHARQGAYIDSVSVAAGAYRLPPNEIPEILPQQLLMLDVVAAALRDAGRSGRHADPRAGMIVGLGLDLNTSNYHHRWVVLAQARRWAAQLGLDLRDDELEAWVAALRDEAGPALNATRVLGSLGSVAASRIAREFGFGGPSFTVSAEEASGLRALEVGVRALQRREIDTAVVGAIDLCGDVRAVVAAGLPQGSLVGEGAVALVLKRLSDAQRDGGRIYAAIRGIGFAGQTPGEQTAAFARSLQRAYDDAGVDPASIGYLEVDTANPDADAALLQQRPTKGCAVGSMNAVAGHCGAASGLAAAVKTALSLYQQVLPAMRDYPGPDGTPWPNGFHLPIRPQFWLRDREDGPRRAAVSVRAFDGNCAHVVLEEVEHAARPAERRQALAPSAEAAFVVSGEDVPQLVRGTHHLRDFLGSCDVGVERAARLWHGRGAADSNAARLAIAFRVSARGADRGEAFAELVRRVEMAARSLERGPADPFDGRDGVYYAPEPLGKLGVAFVFPGSGNHYVGMGREIGTRWPDVLRRLDEQSEHLASQLLPRWFAPWRVTWPDRWQRDAAREIAADTVRVITGQVAHGIVVSDLLRDLGVRPNAAIGYSLGETAALLALRAWPDRDVLFKRMLESNLFRSELAGPADAARRAWRLPADEPVEWRVAVVNRPAAAARQIVERHERVYVLIANTPDECVIGGRAAEVERVVSELGCEAVAVEGASTVHCPITRQVEAEYRAFHHLPTQPPSDIRFYSPAWGRTYQISAETAADSITAQAVGGFDFTRVIERAYADGVRVFVEPGPGASCTRMIGRILRGRPHVACSASARGADEVAGVLDAVAILVAHRAIDDLAGLYGTAGETRPIPATLAEPRRITVPLGAPPPNPRLPERVRRQREQVKGAPAAVVARPSDQRVPLSNARLPDGRGSVQELRHWAMTGVAASAAAAAETGRANARAHDAFLRFSQNATSAMGDALALQSRMLAAMGSAPAKGSSVPRPTSAPVAFTRAQCMEFAVGSLANVFGPAFAPVDGCAKRVRLPDEPLMLVDRIVSIGGEPGTLGPGTIATEHDVQPDAWYLDGGSVPVCIAVEAGQADLFLCSYLGIDLEVKGGRTYRLLDATIRFHRGLPRPGETIRYDIAIDNFVRQGDTWLFFFRFEATVAGQPLLSMTDGCAGFFTEEEIEQSGGIVLTAAETALVAPPADCERPELVPMMVESYDETQIDALRRGDLAACFGPDFADLPIQNPPRLPGGRMRLVHRVVELNPNGGRFGLGLIRAEADIHPDDWFLTCHFVDDMVMPGTLMFECCAHTLRIFLWRMGWVGEHDQMRYEPIVGQRCRLKCRGPVTPATKVVTYEVHIKRIGYGPEPYVLADALMYSDGRRTVQFTDMSLKIGGLSREQIEQTWRATKPRSHEATKTRSEPRASASGPAGRSADAEIHPIGDLPVSRDARPAIFDRDSILAFAAGNPSDAFGEPYRVFDRDRRIARLPRPPYMVLDRITEIHAEAWRLEPGGWIEAQYDVPPDAWYFRANRQPAIPFAVLLEVGLQPCGWLAAFLGSALRSEEDLRFRNLGGRATLHREVFADAGTLTTRVRITDVSEAGGMIVEKFDLQIWQGPRLVYASDTYFGFFSDAALANQVGVRGAAERTWSPGADVRQATSPLSPIPPLTPDDAGYKAGDAACLPAGALSMIDAIDAWLPDGGPHGLGFIRGVKRVDPREWFFDAHFYQDPVCPGSLGLESFQQLLKFVALDRWGNASAAGGRRYTETHRFEPMTVGATHEWVYRGQVVPTNKRVEVEAVVTGIDDGPQPAIRANGFLKVDGLYIYEMIDFGIRLVPDSRRV